MSTEKAIGTESNESIPEEFQNEISIPENLLPAEIIHEIAMTREQFDANNKIAIKMTSYIGAASEDISSRIGVPFEIIGAIQHACTVTDDDGVSKPETRTVIKPVTGKNISFVSMAATSFFNNCVKPFYGSGDFAFPVKILVTAAAGKGNKRTYNFQVVA